MTQAVIFGALSAILLICLLYFLQLLFFYQREVKRFAMFGKKEEYLEYLHTREKKLRCRRKRNFLMYLRCKSYEAQGEKEKANHLLPFVKNDILLEIHK